MSGQAFQAQRALGPDPGSLVEVATGFMRAKHLFVASELGVFEALAGGAKSVTQLAQELKLPPRTTRIILDAVTALGFLKREGDAYRNSEVAEAYLSGQGAQDMRPWMRFWNRLSYPRWIKLEDSVRLGKGAFGEFKFSEAEQKIFSEGVEGFTTMQATALAQSYDFSQHHRILDMGGGTGSFLQIILRQHPAVQGTLFELPGAAGVARQKLRRTPEAERIQIIEGNFLSDALPAEHDVFLVANVVHVLSPEQNQALFRHVAEVAPAGARFFLVDFWTDPTHTEPLFAALMAGEFLVMSGEGDVYSVEEAREWLEKTNWRYLKHRPLAGPASLIIAQAW